MRIPRDQNSRLHHQMFLTLVVMSVVCLWQPLFSGVGLICARPVRYVATFAPLKKEDLLPVDHLDSVHLELDGHLNRDYRREIFFGEDHDTIRPQGKEEEQAILLDLFHKVDIDKSGDLSREELIKWVMLKVQEHLDAAAKMNRVAFNTLDKDLDGFLTWRELLIELMISFGHNSDLAHRFVDDHSLIKLDDLVTAELSLARHRWSMADVDFDNSLNQTEFLHFRHPELSARSQREMAEELLTALDKDHNGVISLVEFAQEPDSAVVVELPFPGFVNDDEKWLAERRREFREVLDSNHDGAASIDELTEYVKPNSRQNAVSEIDSIMQNGDTDKNGRLSDRELLAIGTQIIGSKLINTAAKFHNEL